MEASPHAWAWAPSREASRQSAPQEPRKESEGGRVSAQFMLPRALLSAQARRVPAPEKASPVTGACQALGHSEAAEALWRAPVSRTHVSHVCPTHARAPHTCHTRVLHKCVPLTCPMHTRVPHMCPTRPAMCAPRTHVSHVPRTHVSHAHACPAHMCRTRVPCTRVPRTHMSHAHVSHTCPTHTWPVSFPTGPARSSASSCAAKPPPRSTSTARPSWQTTFSAPLTPTCSRSSSCR